MPPPTIGALHDALHEQISGLRSQLDAVRARSTALDAKKAALHLELAAVMAEETGCKKEIDVLEDALHTVLQKVCFISRIPAEILSEIFLWSVASSPEYITPWRLSHVCRYWRNTARSNPLHWSHITIDCRLASALTYSPAALESQLELSKAVPLKLKLFFIEDNDTEFLHLSNLLDLLLLHSDRWARLVIGTTEDGDGDVFNVIREARHRLSELRYLESEGWNPRWPVDLSYVFAEAPNLKVVSLHRWEFTEDIPCIHLPWHQLTCLYLTAAQDLTLEWLRTAENLVDLKYYELTGRAMETTTDELIVLPQLRRLSLLYGDCITRSLIAPHLQDLEVRFDAKNISEFIHRSACHLSRLSFISSTYNYTSIVTALPRTCNLSHLELCLDAEDSDSDSSVDDHIRFLTDLFRVLILTGCSTDICPNLVSLCIDSLPPAFYREEPEFDDWFCEMLESRWNLSPNFRSLRSVQTKAPLSVRSSIWNRLEALRLDGLDLTKAIWSQEEDDEWEAHMADEEQTSMDDEKTDSD
ncbi:hypothetical protein R3P38DRAFT_3262464 [Favolaschia claudopus]|uniref:F-box domain-containing protein n=1 Tax=Favolaschia claudopus TaxID=2862362 RepID=A0AAW0CGR0_9AGAR